MVSSYLNRPLRTLEQAIDERASRRSPAAAARYADSQECGSDSAESSAVLPTKNTSENGAVEASTAASTGQQSPLRPWLAA